MDPLPAQGFGFYQNSWHLTNIIVKYLKGSVSVSVGVAGGLRDFNSYSDFPGVNLIAPSGVMLQQATRRPR